MPAGFGGGFERALLGFYDASTGVNLGQSSALSNGGSSGAFVLDTVIEGTISFTDPTILEFQGGDQRKGQMMFEAGAAATNFTISISDENTAIVAAITSTTINTTNTEFTKYAYNDNKPTPRNMWVALQQRFLFDTGSEGYRTLIFPRCQVGYRPGGFSFRGESNGTLQVNPQLSSYALTGQLFSSGANNLAFNVTGSKVRLYTLLSDYPIHVVTYRGDGTATSVTLPYLPTSSVVTLNATPNELVLNGTPTALSSVNTSTGVATFTAAPPAGQYAVITYETNFVAP